MLITTNKWLAGVGTMSVAEFSIHESRSMLMERTKVREWSEPFQPDVLPCLAAWSRVWAQFFPSVNSLFSRLTLLESTYPKGPSSAPSLPATLLSPAWTPSQICTLLPWQNKSRYNLWILPLTFQNCKAWLLGVYSFVIHSCNWRSRYRD